MHGQGSIPNVPGLRLVQVGTAVVKSPVLFGDFIVPAENEQSRATLSPSYLEAARYHRPEPPPLVLAEGVSGLASSPRLDAVYRSYAWVAPLEDGTVRAWEIDRLAGDAIRARTVLQTTSSAFDLTAPVEELRTAAEASSVAGRRLLLVGGESAALLFAFAVLAAVSMRRDSEAARQRLTWFGARRWQLSIFTGMEAAVIAIGGTLVGWALGTLAGAAVASRAGAPVSEVLAHSTLSATGLLTGLAIAAALTLVLLAALRAKPVAFGGRSFSALDAAALGALAVVVVTLLRGDLDQESLAAESGTSVALVLLPGLVTFIAAVVCARLLRPVLLLLERASRNRSVSLRLAALSLGSPSWTRRCGRRLPPGQRRPRGLRGELQDDPRPRAGGAGGLRRPPRLHGQGGPHPPHPRAGGGHIRSARGPRQGRPGRARAAALGQLGRRRRAHRHRRARPRLGCDPHAERLARRLLDAAAADARRTGRACRRRRDARPRAPRGRDGPRASGARASLS